MTTEAPAATVRTASVASMSYQMRCDAVRQAGHEEIRIKGPSPSPLKLLDRWDPPGAGAQKREVLRLQPWSVNQHRTGTSPPIPDGRLTLAHKQQLRKSANQLNILRQFMCGVLPRC